jgi:hypothetical protein
MAMGTGIPALPFMRDGMKKSKDRLSRISHDVPGTPFCLRKENPFLMLSDSTTQSFEADMLKIGNFLNSHLHAHVHQHVARQHGKAAAKLVVPPLVLFKMIQSAVNSMTDSGHGWHDDSGSFVSDNTLGYGDEDHNMIVPTFIWSNRRDVSTSSVTWAQKGQKSNSKTTDTLTAECHTQSSGVQANQEHCVTKAKKWLVRVSQADNAEPGQKKQKRTWRAISKDDHRLAQSLRSTDRFLERHNLLLATSNPDIMCVGHPSDYNFRIRLGNVATNFFSSGAGLHRLHLEKISPVVHCTVGIGTRVSFGLAMESGPGGDGRPRPYPPGRVLVAAAVCSGLGLSTSITHTQVWKADPEALNDMVLAKDYKSEFPTRGMSAKVAKRPLIDYRRVKPGHLRLGFWYGGGGGAAEQAGETAPGANRPSSLESAKLEQAQKVFSPQNAAMMKAASRNAWIRVYLIVGPKGIVPEMEVDYEHPLSAKLQGSSTAKVVDLGCYEVVKATLEADNTDELFDNLSHQQGLAECNLCKLPSTEGDFGRYCRFRT